MLHPLRLRILRTLGQYELTPLELAKRLPDVAQATLYRHLKKLEAAQLIEVVKEKVIRGTTEKTYRVAQFEPSSEEMAQATPDDWMHLFSRFTASLLSDFGAYLAADPEPLKDGVGFRQILLYLSPEELQQMSLGLNTALQPYLNNEPSQERRGRTLSTVLLPEPLSSDSEEARRIP